LVNVVSDRWHNRKWPAVVGILLQAVAVAHMLGFTIAGESVTPAMIGSASAIVNGICFIIGGVLEAVPGKLLPASPDLDDYQSALWVMPVVLVAGAVCAILIKEPSRANAPDGS
jgi:hypothetical protein